MSMRCLRIPQQRIKFHTASALYPLHSILYTFSMTTSQPWWQTAVIYQVYPRSFQDTNGDGIGDLPGITARLGYLAGLGVQAIWISPFYPSPMADFGYDVADYTGVAPIFGTLDDFDTLLKTAHEKGLKVILDFVPNHTSDQHPWFLESRSSRTNPKRDWYLWRDAGPSVDRRTFGQTAEWRPARSRMPNNWMSHFGGPAWTFDHDTQQFYLHSFLSQQPDLNWRNPEVREAIYAAMRFWLDRGVDGFRMDVLWLLIKDRDFRDNPRNPDWNEGDHSHYKVLPARNADQPETLSIVREMRSLLDSYSGDRLLIGEIYLPLDRLVRYLGEADAEGVPQLNGAHLPFNFHLIQAQWEAAAIAKIIREYERLLPPGAWPNYVLGNHDQSRLATRIGPRQARAAAMLLLTLRGTPTLYYGDELGMQDVPIAPDQVQDPAEKNEPNKGKGRDPERSPMLWVNSPNAGFAPPEATPWLPLQADWPTVNASTQRSDPRSTLTLYRKLLQLRAQHDTLHSGAIADVSAEGSILRYRRVGLPEGDSGDFLVLLNLGNDVATTQTPKGTVILTTLLDGEGAAVEGPITIESGEGILIALE